MQVFVPYPSPIDVAKCLDPKRLRKQIIECKQIMLALEGESSAWINHPATKTYEHYYSWLHDYCLCLENFLANNSDMVKYWNDWADSCAPPFLTSDFCDQHKRRLYTKAPELYPQFAKYGKSEENWYFVDGRLRRYVNGKEVYGVPWLLDMKPDGSPVEDLKQICKRT